MKIRIKLKSDKWSMEHTGKGRFCAKLIPELKKLGCTITDDLKQKVDIDFQIGRWHYQPESCTKTILRIGPAHISSKSNHKWLNSRKAKAVKKADGIIYQSKLGKKMVDKHIYKRKKLSTIIYNGSTTTDTEPFESDYKYNFLASTRIWTKQKRLARIKKAFLEANIQDSCLWVLGDTGRDTGGEHYSNLKIGIEEMGLVDEKTIKSLYKKCNAMVHLVWLDCMPNSVCEALAEGCQIITNNASGTREIVEKAGGMVLHCEEDWHGEIVNTQKPPKINLDLLANGFREILGYPAPKNDHVLIENIAKQYFNFFQEVLGARKNIPER